MPDLSLPGGIYAALARAATTAFLWVFKRPLLFTRRLWVAALLVVSAITIATAAFLSPLVAALPLLSTLVIAAVLGHWLWLGRGNAPIVFVSQFKARSEAGREAAETHLGALINFLGENEFLEKVGPLSVRPISLPLSARQAEQLLRLSNALMVIRGTGDAAAGVSRWEWWAHFRSTHLDFDMNKFEFSLLEHNEKPPLLTRLRTIPATASSHDVEGGTELKEFVATTIKVPHFQILGKIAGVLASELVLEREESDPRPRALAFPEPEDSDLGPELQGRAAILEARLRLGKGASHEDVLRYVNELCLDEIRDAGFALWVQAQWFAGLVEGWIEPADAYAADLEIADQHPENLALLLNAASGALKAGDLEGAEGLVALVPECDGTRMGIERLHGHIAWQKGEPDVALGEYLIASRRGSPLTWQIGDCYAALGHPKQALRYYRKELRANSAALAATEHARAILGTPPLLPTIPSGWRGRLWGFIHLRPLLASLPLRIWRRRRPEDPWLAPFLGRHALVTGKTSVARPWVILAGRSAGTNRIVATVDQAVVSAALDEDDLDRLAEFFGKHLSWLEEAGFQDARDEATDVLALLLASNPRLLPPDAHRNLEAAMHTAGVSMTAKFD